MKRTQAAVDWLLRLDSPHSTPADPHAFSAWLAANPSHAAAWQRVTGLLQQPFNQLQRIIRGNLKPPTML